MATHTKASSASPTRHTCSAARSNCSMARPNAISANAEHAPAPNADPRAAARGRRPMWPLPGPNRAAHANCHGLASAPAVRRRRAATAPSARPPPCQHRRPLACVRVQARRARTSPRTAAPRRARVPPTGALRGAASAIHSLQRSLQQACFEQWYSPWERPCGPAAPRPRGPAAHAAARWAGQLNTWPVRSVKRSRSCGVSMSIA